MNSQAEEQLKAQVALGEEQIIAGQLSAISKRVKKRPLVLFFGRNTFADNTKYLYLKAVSEKRDYEVLWCTIESELAASLKKAGLPVHHIGKNMDASLDVLLHAAVAVFCVNPNESLRGSFALTACLDGAKKLQLWHGVSVKHLLLTLIPHLSVRELVNRRAWEFASRADYVLSTAATFDAYWRNVFGCKTLVRAGFPRNEVILRGATKHELIGCDLPDSMQALLAGSQKKVLVVPTWQRERPTWLTSEECLVGLSQLGQKKGITFFVKAHPTYQATGGDTHEIGGLQILNPGVDVYPLLSSFDALVTDYSSIQFDFLLTGKPVLSLDLKPGEHQSFEPDWSLVPNVDFRHRFGSQNFEARLHEALHSDGLADARREMCSKLFETDPREASSALLRLIGRLVKEATADDFSVDYCEEAPALSELASGLTKSLTDAA
jgi:CDP-glycerol glycerophosphotransferase